MAAPIKYKEMTDIPLGKLSRSDRYCQEKIGRPRQLQQLLNGSLERGQVRFADEGADFVAGPVVEKKRR